jgi:hypothetical protein
MRLDEAHTAITVSGLGRRGPGDRRRRRRRGDRHPARVDRPGLQARLQRTEADTGAVTRIQRSDPQFEHLRTLQTVSTPAPSAPSVRHYARRFRLSLRRFVQTNPMAFYFVRGHRIRMKDAARLQSLYQLSSAEPNQTLSDLWSQTVLRELAKLTPEELMDLREATFKTEKMRALDQYSLGAFLSLRGLSPEAIEMLGVAWGYETSLNTALTEILREEHERSRGLS